MKYITLILITFLLTITCLAQDSLNNTNMNKSPYIISETNDNIQHLIAINKYCNYKYEIHPETEGETFYLMFDIVEYPKPISNSFIKKRYDMQVNKTDNTFKMKLRLTSSTFYENGENVGHAKPTGEWYIDDKLSEAVLNYYFLRENQIASITLDYYNLKTPEKPKQSFLIDSNYWNLILTTIATTKEIDLVNSIIDYKTIKSDCIITIEYKDKVIKNYAVWRFGSGAITDCYNLIDDKYRYDFFKVLNTYINKNDGKSENN